MQIKSLRDIEKEYNLELDKVVRTIKKSKARTVLLQFPDGMKPFSTIIASEIKRKSKSEIMVWLGTCYGACDVPNIDDKLNVDLIVQFGHSAWNYKEDIKVL